MSLSPTELHRLPTCRCCECNRSHLFLHILPNSESPSATEQDGLSKFDNLRAWIKLDNHSGQQGDQSEKHISLDHTNESALAFRVPDHMLNFPERHITIVLEMVPKSAKSTFLSTAINFLRIPKRQPEYSSIDSFSSSDQSYDLPYDGHKLDSRLRHFKMPQILIMAIGLTALIVAVCTFALLPFSQHGTNIWPEDGYIRYPTPGSNGPKRQLRILYQNATEWSRKNPHNNGQWRMRIDDQALVPIEAWDRDEDRIQQWFANRYPGMRHVVETRSYLRPSWLGSLNVSVPWDDQFHFAHCIVAMRRYWKAKETGTHVCPRDISPTHVQHFLNWLDGIVFKPEPGLPYMGPEMAWQTKLCF